MAKPSNTREAADFTTSKPVPVPPPYGEASAKTEGIKIRGTGAAVKGVTARGSMA